MHSLPKAREYYQTPESHLQGCGCPKCQRSKLEEEIENLLASKNISYRTEVGKTDLEWLNRQSLDFYLPNYNIAIECQGIQHFVPIDFFGGTEHYNYVKKLDNEKRELCEKHNIKLLYYSNIEIEYPYKVFTNKNALLQEIDNYAKRQ